MSHVDIISDVLSAAVKAFPDNDFVQSLAHQYLVRGSLSKKQLQGLYGKAQKLTNFPPGKLATLQAIILKKHTKYRSALPETAPLYQKDEDTGNKIKAVLARYPQHKRVLYFQLKWEKSDPLNAVETTELQKFYKMVTG